MKIITSHFFIPLVLAFFLEFQIQPSTAHAQGTAFTYQGRLNVGGNPASGVYDLTFTLFNVNSNGFAWAGPVTNSAKAISNGLFTAVIDFGPGVFDGANYWLEIGVRTNGGAGFNALSPRQQLFATPYALMAGSASNLLGVLPTSKLTGTFPANQLSGTIPSANLSGTYNGAVNFNNGSDEFNGTFIGQFFGSSFFGGSFSGEFFGDGGGLFNLNASLLSSGTVPDARLGASVVRTNQVWLLGGNGGTNPGTNFIGTTDNQPLVVKVNGLETMRYEPATNSANIIGGYSGNSANGTLNYGVTIAGGGQVGLPNTISGVNVTFATIAGGAANTINGTNAYHSVISGGTYNNITGDSVFESVVAGGSANTIQGWASAIGGGTGNLIQPVADHSVIAGGFNNWIQGAGWDSFIGGGYGGVIQSNAQFSSIVGGNYNTNGSSYAIIGGGYYNFIEFNNWGAFIGAGANNDIFTGSGYSAINSGYGNMIRNNASYSVIGGGSGNLIQTFADHAVIAGGYNNEIRTNAWDSAVVGGFGNLVRPFAVFSTIGGGEGNDLHEGASHSMIASGFFNDIGATNFASFIGGGQGNLIDSFNNLGVIGGGLDNRIAGNYVYYTNFFAIGSTIAGGTINVIDWNNLYDTIGGGWNDVIQSNVIASTIAGGINNVIQTNAYGATVGGGYFNQVGGKYSAIPGGVDNIAYGDGSFAAGAFAHATNIGAFVLADYQFTNFNSTASNQLSARFTGGVVFVTGGAGMTLDGQPILSGSVLGGQLSGFYSNAVTIANPGDFFGGDGSGLLNLNASQLTSGTVPAGVFSGKYTNAVTMTNIGNIFAGNGAGLTAVNAATLSGLSSSSFAPASGSANYIQNQPGSPQSASFNINGNGTISGYLRLGSETNTASGPGYPIGSPGLVIRRISSTSSTAGSLVARTDQLQLQRDGSVSGLQIAYSTSGFQTINAVGITTNNTQVIYRNTIRSASSGTLAMFTDSQKVVHYDISFGNPFNNGHTCRVVLDRYDDGITSDNFLVGTITTTYNQ